MILILGGTAEARELAAGLVARGVEVTSSLAGRVGRPRLPAGRTRIGGFGGPDGLAGWIAEHGVGAVVDATHPFAERISASAAQACPRAGVSLLRLERPGWSERAGDRWQWVDDLDEAAAAVRSRRGGSAPDGGVGPRRGARAPDGAARPRVFLTTGRQGLAAFADIDDAWFLVRCVDPPGAAAAAPPRAAARPRPLHARWRARAHRRARDRPRRDEGQRAASMTVAKLDAARERGLPVIVVRRPPRPGTVPTVRTVGEALEWACAAAGTCP